MSAASSPYPIFNIIVTNRHLTIKLFQGNSSLSSKTSKPIPNVEPWQYPFNIEGLDIRSSYIDLEFCKDKHLSN